MSAFVVLCLSRGYQRVYMVMMPAFEGCENLYLGVGGRHIAGCRGISSIIVFVPGAGFNSDASHSTVIFECSPRLPEEDGPQ
jgi:hypothetical protein